MTGSQEVFGAVTAHDISITGAGVVHYDEALGY
jgi:hypothetical protein